MAWLPEPYLRRRPTSIMLIQTPLFKGIQIQFEVSIISVFDPIEIDKHLMEYLSGSNRGTHSFTSPHAEIIDGYIRVHQSPLQSVKFVA